MSNSEIKVTKGEGRFSPCPFCKEGQTNISFNTFWTGMRSVVTSVELRHWCKFGEGGRDRGFVSFVCNTEEEAVSRWNTR